MDLIYRDLPAVDFCYQCVDYTVWTTDGGIDDGAFCTRCGRTWGYDLSATPRT